MCIRDRYNASMSPGSLGLGSPDIVQSGISGSYSYSVASSRENDPVSTVSWGDAARFCNWLANRQPATGVENASTTEDGSYALNGAVTDQQLALVTRSPAAVYVIPTQNEWYKSSYYKGGSANAGYWSFPTQSDTPPSNFLSTTGTNNANFADPVLGFTDPVSYTHLDVYKRQRAACPSSIPSRRDVKAATTMEPRPFASCRR